LGKPCAKPRQGHGFKGRQAGKRWSDGKEQKATLAVRAKVEEERGTPKGSGERCLGVGDLYRFTDGEGEGIRGRKRKLFPMPDALGGCFWAPIKRDDSMKEERCGGK